jgi:DNA topoisomerase VI subunit A
MLTSASRRSIYYDNPELFGTQSVVNTIVDDIAYTVGVDRAALHVVCTQYAHSKFIPDLK